MNSGSAKFHTYQINKLTQFQLIMEKLFFHPSKEVVKTEQILRFW